MSLLLNEILTVYFEIRPQNLSINNNFDSITLKLKVEKLLSFRVMLGGALYSGPRRLVSLTPHKVVRLV
jgi:hypothetical protein